MITFKSEVYVLESLQSLHYVEVPVSVIKELGSLKTRVHCTINDQITFQTGLVALGEGRGYIAINAARRKKIGLKKGHFVSVRLGVDKSKYGLAVPEELEEWLNQDPEAEKRFESIAPGKKRYIIAQIAALKSPIKRLEKTQFLIENLKNCPIGQESYARILGKAD